MEMEGSGDEVSKLADVISQVHKKTPYFKSQLSQIQEVLIKLNPAYKECEEQNQDWGGWRMYHTEILIRQLTEAEEIVRKCEQIEWSAVKIVHQMWKLHDLKKGLWWRFTDYLDSQMRENSGELSPVAKDIKKKLETGSWSWNVTLPDEDEYLKRRLLIDSSAENVMFDDWCMSFLESIMRLEQSVDSSRASRGDTERGDTVLRGIVIGFDQQLMNLKRMLLKDSSRQGDDDCHVVVISGEEGCGKTTLAKMLCNDSEIEGTFGSNIYFVTISKDPDLESPTTRYVYPFNALGRRENFARLGSFLNARRDYREKIARWKSFLNARHESPVLLVLDDVCSPSIIEDFRFKHCGCKILVTSRTTFPTFDTYTLLPLADRDAISLLCYSALSDHVRQTNDDDDKEEEIPADLVYMLAKCCRKHPSTLIATGNSLSGTPVGKWQQMLNRMPGSDQAAIDLQMDKIWRSLIA